MASGYPRIPEAATRINVYLAFNECRVLLEQPLSWAHEFRRAYCLLADEVYFARRDGVAIWCIKGRYAGTRSTLRPSAEMWWRLHSYSRLNENAYAVERCLKSPREARADVIEYIMECAGYPPTPGSICTESFINQLGG